MNKIRDRVKMRQEYLAEKAEAKVQKAIAISGTVVCVVVTLIFAFCSIIYPNIGCFVILFGFALGVIMGIKAVRDAIREDLAIPYVPPVRQQIAALPAEEILVRGSQASSASQAELLRPAGSDQTPAEELLRASGEYSDHEDKKP